MGLSSCNLHRWAEQKTVQLSDTYQVYIKLYDTGLFSDYVEMQECTSVKLPNYKLKEEIYDYGNNSKKFLIPDYTGLEDLELEFLENYTAAGEMTMRNIVDLCLHKLFDQEKFAYKLDDYIPEIKINIVNNAFDRLVYSYVFKNLKLTDYSIYDLDYTSDSTVKWTLKFSYQSYIVETEYETYLPSSTPTNSVTLPDTEPTAENITDESTSEPVDYAAMYAATMQGRSSRGVQTPNEDLDMAQDHLKNLEGQKPKLTQLDKQQKELQELDAQKAELQKQLENAKLDVEQKSKAYWETVDALEKLNQKVEENERYNHGNDFGFKWKYTEAVNAYNEGIKKKDAAQRDAAAADMAVEKIEKQITDIESRQKAVQAEFDKKKASDAKKSKIYQDDLATAREQVERLQNAADEYNSASASNHDKASGAAAYEARLIAENKKKNTEAAQKRLYDEYELGRKWMNGNKEDDFNGFMNELNDLEKSEPVENVMKENVAYNPEYFELQGIDLDDEPENVPAGRKIMADSGLGTASQKILYDKTTVNKRIENLGNNMEYQDRVTQRITELKNENPNLDDQILYERAANDVQQEMLRSGEL